MQREAESCLRDVTRRFGYSELTSNQREAILKFVSGSDVLVVLPTGSGKSICFAALPWMFDGLRGRLSKSVVIVVAPLNSLMKDQVLSFSRIGMKAAFVSAPAIAEEPDLPERVAAGDFQLVYIGPEMLVESGFFREMLMNEYYQQYLVGFIVDEAHCIKSWGDDFRKAFQRLGEARSLMPGKVNVMALTATAVAETQAVICRTLCMDKGTHRIIQSPLRDNIKFCVSERQPKFINSHDCLQPLLDELAVKRTKLPRTIIFCQRLKDCTEMYEFFKTRLGRNFTEPPEYPDLSFFRLVEMFMSTTAEDVKEEVIKDFRDRDGHIRVLICTSAFGMGVDCQCVERVYHWGTPSDIEMYVQEVGRGGRGTEKCSALLLVKPSEVKGTFKDLCSGSQCRRLTLEMLFCVPHVQPLSGWCCDVCDS